MNPLLLMEHQSDGCYFRCKTDAIRIASYSIGSISIPTSIKTAFIFSFIYAKWNEMLCPKVSSQGLFSSCITITPNTSISDHYAIPGLFCYVLSIVIGLINHIHVEISGSVVFENATNSITNDNIIIIKNGMCRNLMKLYGDFVCHRWEVSVEFVLVIVSRKIGWMNEWEKIIIWEYYSNEITKLVS